MRPYDPSSDPLIRKVAYLEIALLLTVSLSCNRSPSETNSSTLKPEPSQALSNRALGYDDVHSMLARPSQATLDARPSRQEIERDLTLELSASEDLPSGGRLPLVVTLSNRSRTNAHRIVLPNDGYEVGWTQPALFCRAQLRGPGHQWNEVPPRVIQRCGNMNGNWPDFVYELKPGQTIPLRNWVRPEEWVYFWEPGHTRLTVHYIYGVRWEEGKPVCSEARSDGPMKGVPGFHLTVSIEFEVLPPPLKLELRIIGTADFHKNVKLSDLLEARLKNDSNSPVEIAGPGQGGSQLIFENYKWDCIGTTPPPSVVLEPHQTLSILEGETFGTFGRMTTALDGVERHTYAIFQAADRDAKGRPASVRSNEIVFQAHR